MYFKCLVPGCPKLLDSIKIRDQHMEQYHCGDCGTHAEDVEAECKRCHVADLLEKTNEVPSES